MPRSLSPSTSQVAEPNPTAAALLYWVVMLASLLSLACQPAQAQTRPASAATRWGGFDQVAERARRLAAEPYKASPETLPAELKSLNYDQVRDIRFKPQRALWHDLKLPYEAMFFHLGK